MYALVWIWGLRLTYNFARKGGYKKGGEDYRWEYIRKRYPVILVELLNFFFTAYYQIFLIYLFSLPIEFADGAALTTVDYVLTALFLILVLTETVADNQQWAFQQEKRRLQQKGSSLPSPYSLGFITTGLFKYSRHPNFFA
jgi:steroid 5-alpha reductase family enzyme